MNRTFKNFRNNRTIQILVILSLAFFLYTMGCIGMLTPETKLQSLHFTPLTILLSLIVVLLFAETKYSLRTILTFLFIAVSGFLIEAAGVNTGIIFGQYSYGKTLGLSLFNTPLIIGVNWLLLIYATASVFEKFPMLNIYKILLASLLMVIYDFILEPVAPKMDMWQFTGNVAPLQNYMSWFVIAVAFHSIIKWQRVNTRNSVATWILVCQFLFFLILLFFLK